MPCRCVHPRPRRPARCQTRRIIGMGQRWGSEGLDAAHARQLQQLLRDVSKLEGLVLRQVEQSVADQVRVRLAVACRHPCMELSGAALATPQSTLLRADQEARLLYAPIQATRAEAAADGAGTSETGNALWFQKAWLRRIERRATKLRVRGRGNPSHLYEPRCVLTAMPAWLAPGDAQDVSCAVSTHLMQWRPYSGPRTVLPVWSRTAPRGGSSRGGVLRRGSRATLSTFAQAGR